MTRTFLIATIAALAISAPAQAQRDREDRGKRAEQGEQAQAQRAEKRAARQQQASERRAAVQQQVSERRAARQQQVAERRAFRPQQVSERRERIQQQVSERRASRQQEISDRRARIQQRVSDRRSRSDQDISDRRGRMQQIASERRAQRQQEISDRRSRRQQIVSDRRSRFQQEASDRRSRRQQILSDRESRRQQITSDRGSRRQQILSDRQSRRQQILSDRQSRFQQERSDDRELAFDGRLDGQRAERFTRLRQQAWQQRADRLRVLSDRRERLRDRMRWDDDDRDDRRRTLFRVGQRVNRDWWSDDYVPVRYSTRFIDNDDYYYRYDGDYLYRLRDDDDLVMALFPILGGAYSVGRPLPLAYNSYYNVPWGYSSLYYDTPEYSYRYGDGAIYQIDPTTQLIAGIVALLTGQNFGIGQMLPMGYDAYNVPYAYRGSYYDTDDMWYRYDDGYIYGIDPRTRLIEASYPAYGGYAVGYPWQSYAGYDYDVPGYYDDLYYDEPGYDYRYASNGIYAVDPTTQLVTALVALVTGQNFAVGQRLPLGYDAYNVPFAYRDDYFDDDDDWYRYADGRILQVDPRTRLIRRVIDIA